jgi:hypothetical protein
MGLALCRSLASTGGDSPAVVRRREALLVATSRCVATRGSRPRVRARAGMGGAHGFVTACVRTQPRARAAWRRSWCLLRSKRSTASGDRRNDCSVTKGGVRRRQRRAVAARPHRQSQTPRSAAFWLSHHHGAEVNDLFCDDRRGALSAWRMPVPSSGTGSVTWPADSDEREVAAVDDVVDPSADGVRGCCLERGLVSVDV